MEKVITEMSELDQRLDRQLKRLQANGVVDLKVHIEVTSQTNVNDTKRVLADLFEREEAGEIFPSRPLSSFKNFDELMEFIS